MRQPRVVVRHSPIHGRGVFANRAIAAGERIVEYRGRRVPTAEAARTDAGRTASGHTYTFALNDEWVIDGSVDGNCARWINHACEPNCEAVIDVDIDGDPRRDRVWIQALRRIRKGEELGFDYDILLAVPHSTRLRRLWACHCGARGCRGTLLADRGKRRKRRG